MLSFRVQEQQAQEASRWAVTLGIGRSDLLRQALHRHLVNLTAATEAARYAETPLKANELTLAEIADWGPAEEWSDWSDLATAADSTHATG